MHISHEYSPRAIFSMGYGTLRSGIEEYLRSNDIDLDLHDNRSVALACATHYYYELIIFHIERYERKSLPVSAIRMKNPDALIVILCDDILPSMRALMLEHGADMIIDTSIGSSLLLLQIEALTRKLMPESRRMIGIDRLVIDRDKQSAIFCKRSIDLRRREFLLLSYLASHPNTVLTRSDLMKKIWPGIKVKENTVDSHIRRVRKKLGDGASRLIRTIHTKGYCLEPSVC